MRGVVVGMVSVAHLLAACGGGEREREPSRQDQAATPEEQAALLELARAEGWAAGLGSHLPVHFTRNADNVRREVAEGFQALREDAPSADGWAPYVARECPDAVLGRAIFGGSVTAAAIGDAATLDVTEVAFLTDVQARIATRLLTADGALIQQDTEPTHLWVWQGGRWRTAGDCPFYGTVAE